MSTLTLTSALGGGEWSVSCLSLLTLGEEPLVSFKQRAEVGGVS
jgi:hypothetical protein